MAQLRRAAGRGEELRDLLVRQLGTDHIDIYRPARLDPNDPIGETVGAIGKLIDAGYVRHIGRGVSVAQIAIAWVLAQGDDIVPLIGARHRDRLAEAVGALDVTLTDEDLKRIEEAVPADAAAGHRYAPAQMQTLDSEPPTVSPDRER